MDKLFEGKVALVTGGGSGIGRATALAFAQRGAKVVVADLVAKGGEETVRMIKEAGGTSIFLQADVSKSQDALAMVGKTVETYGHLDCAFNNAGVGIPGSTIDCAEEDWDRVLQINLKGVWLCMKYEIPQMLKQGSGSIVNTASAGGLIGTPGLAAYTASKHGVVGLTKTAALEYVQQGIRINAVCPGTVTTPMVKSSIDAFPDLEKILLSKHPMGRFARSEEIADAVLWLSSDGASYVTGIALSVDGGVVAQ
jgi:NAD(P)-dependent dehydrogenase (short-subunit alcohol dehydrogenase family)